MDGTTIGIIIAGIISIIAAIVTGAVTVINAVQATKKEVEAIKGINTVQTAKLDNITILVDGRYSAVLQELADVKDILAKETGLAADRLRAESAQITANTQADSVARSKE